MIRLRGRGNYVYFKISILPYISDGIQNGAARTAIQRTCYCRFMQLHIPWEDSTAPLTALPMQ